MNCKLIFSPLDKECLISTKDISIDDTFETRSFSDLNNCMRYIKIVYELEYLYHDLKVDNSGSSLYNNIVRIDLNELEKEIPKVLIISHEGDNYNLSRYNLNIESELISKLKRLRSVDITEINYSLRLIGNNIRINENDILKKKKSNEDIENTISKNTTILNNLDMKLIKIVTELDDIIKFENTLSKNLSELQEKINLLSEEITN